MLAPAERLYPLIVIAVLAGSTLWLDYSTSERDSTPQLRLRDKPDFIAEQARLVSFNEQGLRHYELTSPRIVHFPIDNVTVLDAPVLNLAQDARKMRIDARQAEVHARGDEILLQQDVLVWRQGLGDEADMTLETNSLTVWPNDQRAASDEAVRITQGPSVATAQGLRADNLFGTLELVGQASVRFDGRTRAQP